VGVLGQFAEVWAVDTEFRRLPGGLPDPVCCVCAQELKSGREIALWTEHGARQPFDTGPRNLFVFQYGVAEMLAFTMLGWELPAYCIDTYVEGRVLTNGLPGRKAPGIDQREGRRRRCGLLHLAARYGIASMSDAMKDAGRELAMRGGPWTGAEQDELLRYCLEDAVTCGRVFLAMLPEIAAPRHGFAQALLRARYMKATAAMEVCGVPIDRALFAAFKANWKAIRAGLIEATDPGRYDCFEDGVFRRRRFEALLDRLNIKGWPRTPTGMAATDDKTFRSMVVTYPALAELRELHATLQQMKEFDFGLGADGRHRAEMLSAFGTDTARHNPSKFVFALARWFRGLIKPGPGMAVVYSDFRAEEISIAAWLSQDPNLLAAVRSDPYLWYAVEAGLVPPGATKDSHKELRDWLKPFLLGIHYGLTVVGAASRLGISIDRADELFTKHKRLFPVYWKWSTDKVHAAAEAGVMVSRWGWRMRIGPGTTSRSLKNHPIQTMGSHILHFAGIGLVESGIRVCCPVHDAVLTECPISELNEHVRKVQAIMCQAAKTALGMEIRVDSEVVRHPERYMDKRGRPMFDKAVRALGDARARAAAGPAEDREAHKNQCPSSCLSSLSLP
jgi:DNA polymerase I